MFNRLCFTLLHFCRFHFPFPSEAVNHGDSLHPIHLSHKKIELLNLVSYDRLPTTHLSNFEKEPTICIR
jgi:hypothetical protein